MLKYKNSLKNKKRFHRIWKLTEEIGLLLHLLPVPVGGGQYADGQWHMLGGGHRATESAKGFLGENFALLLRGGGGGLKRGNDGFGTSGLAYTL